MFSGAAKGAGILILVILIEPCNEQIRDPLIFLVALDRLQDLVAVLIGERLQNDQLDLTLQQGSRILDMRDQRKIDLAVLVQNIDQLEELLVALLIDKRIKIGIVHHFIHWHILILHLLLRSAGLHPDCIICGSSAWYYCNRF